MPTSGKEGIGYDRVAKLTCYDDWRTRFFAAGMYVYCSIQAIGTRFTLANPSHHKTLLHPPAFTVLNHTPHWI